MTKAELIQLLGWRLGDRTDMAARAELELDFVQDNQLEGAVWCPWFLVSELSQATTTAGESRLPLPTDFLMEMEESHLYAVNAEGVAIELVKKDLDVLDRGKVVEGFPAFYAVSGKYFHFYPTPDAAYSVQMRYYAKASRIRDDMVVSPWLQYAADLVLAELGTIIAGKHIQNPEAAAGFASDAKGAWKRLYDKHVALGELNHPRALGGNV